MTTSLIGLTTVISFPGLGRRRVWIYSADEFSAQSDFLDLAYGED